MAGAFEVTHDLDDVAKALSYEANAPKLRRDLATQLRKAVEPAAEDARGRIKAWAVTGAAHKGGSLRAAIAAGVKTQARLSGRATGVRVRVTRPSIRGFTSAPRRTNREKGWRHPVPPGRLPEGVEGPEKPPVWVHQEGPIGWFDNPMKERASEYAAAARRVIDDTAARIRSAT